MGLIMNQHKKLEVIQYYRIKSEPFVGGAKTAPYDQDML